jgi:exosortase B
MTVHDPALGTAARLVGACAWRQRAAQWLPWAGLAAMAVPVLADLVRQVWAGDEQSHGPVILAVALWLIWRQRWRLASLQHTAWPVMGWSLLLLACLAYVVGRSQQILQFEVLAPWLAALGLLLLRSGFQALRVIALPLLCLLLVVPMPGVLVQTVTLPLKIAVSNVAEWLLHGVGYPVARSGVVLAIDQYQLLVADACAGLTSMFTLEAMGLVYIQLRGHAAPLRNVLLALLIVPISFVANVVRVVVLVLVTFHLGDAAGQGFVHSAAGVLLFVVAMLLLLSTDAALGRCLSAVPGRGFRA